MVDVTPKEPTHRRAVARCRVHMQPDTAQRIASGAISKGDVLAVARVAGIQAAKLTPNLLPLCHPLLVGAVYAGDYGLVLGVTTISIIGVSAAVLLIDLIYPLLDPRVEAR